MFFRRSTKRDAQLTQEERLAKAQKAGSELEAAAKVADSQVSFVNRLMEGWREVHQTNHLAELFRQEYRGSRD